MFVVDAMCNLIASVNVMQWSQKLLLWEITRNDRPPPLTGSTTSLID